MNKSIKVSDVVYGELLKLQQPRETFSDVVARLIKLYYVLQGAAPMIGGAEAYWRSQVDERDGVHSRRLDGKEMLYGTRAETEGVTAPDVRPGDSAEVPHV